MGKAKRMKETESKDMPKILKYFLILLILVVIVFFVLFYLVKTNKIAFLNGFFNNIGFSDIEKNNNDDIVKNADDSKDELTKLSEQVKIINSDKLIANKLEISKSSDNTYSISTTILNNSNKKMKKLKITLNIYDSKKAELASYEFNIDAIVSKSKSTLHTISSSDLSDASYYSLVFNK